MLDLSDPDTLAMSTCLSSQVRFIHKNPPWKCRQALLDLQTLVNKHLSSTLLLIYSPDCVICIYFYFNLFKKSQLSTLMLLQYPQLLCPAGGHWDAPSTTTVLYCWLLSSSTTNVNSFNVHRLMSFENHWHSLTQIKTQRTRMMTSSLYSIIMP